MRNQVILIASTIVCSLLIASIDVSLTRIWGWNLLLFPIYIVVLYYLLYHFSLKWVVLGASLLLYMFIMFVPIVWAAILLGLLLFADYIITRLSPHLTVLNVLIIAEIVVVGCILALASAGSMNTWLDWQFTISTWSKDVFISIVSQSIWTLLILLISYPVFSRREARRKQYTNIS